MKVTKKHAILGILSTILGIGTTTVYIKKMLQEQNQQIKRYRDYYTLTNQWLQNKATQKTVDIFFENHKLHSIAIYGMGSMGDTLFHEIEHSKNVFVKYFIDQAMHEIYDKLYDKPIIGIDEIQNQEQVDAIVITPVYDYKKICQQLKNKGIDISLISLEDIIFGC